MFKLIFWASVMLALVPAACAQTSDLAGNDPIDVGETAPDFVLQSTAKTEITLSKVDKTTVLIFFRGYW